MVHSPATRRPKIREQSAASECSTLAWMTLCRYEPLSSVLMNCIGILLSVARRAHRSGSLGRFRNGPPYVTINRRNVRTDRVEVE